MAKVKGKLCVIITHVYSTQNNTFSYIEHCILYTDIGKLGSVVGKHVAVVFCTQWML